VLLKYFLAEGVVNSHSLFVGSAAADLDAGAILKELPAPIIDDPGEDVAKSGDGDDSMKIAWRYQNLPQHQVRRFRCRHRRAPAGCKLLEPFL
jgi:elongator complex protein 4